MRRGEVWWADVPPPSGRRPVVLLSRDSAYAVRASVTVAPITRTRRGIPTETPLDQTDGMPAPCVVNLDDILTIPKDLLRTPVTTLSRSRLAAVEQSVLFALDIKAP